MNIVYIDTIDRHEYVYKHPIDTIDTIINTVASIDTVDSIENYRVFIDIIFMHHCL